MDPEGHQVEWIADEGGFASLAAEWDRLVPAEGSPFDLHCWYLAWWRAFGGSTELAVCAVRRQGRLVGAFPLRRVDGALRPLTNEHTSHFRPVALDDDALRALCDQAMREAGPGLVLDSLPAADAALDALAAATRTARRIPHVEAEFASPFVDTGGDMEAWRAESKPRWGAPLERFRRKMARDHVAELAIVEPPADLEADLSDGFRVEGSGWKGREGTAILSTPEAERFYLDVGRAFHARGELRLSRISLDGESAAFDLCILHGGRLHLLKTGFDERFRKLAPGLVMRLTVIERCFEMGLDSHELLGRQSEWKAKFATGDRDFASLRVYPRTPSGAARQAYRQRVRPGLKSAYRRLRPPAA